jgi:hypothetical protein
MANLMLSRQHASVNAEQTRPDAGLFLLIGKGAESAHLGNKRAA